MIRLGKITSKESYGIMKKAVSLVKRRDHIEGKIDPNQLFDFRNAFVSEIQHSWEQRESEKDPGLEDCCSG